MSSVNADKSFCKLDYRLFAIIEGAASLIRCQLLRFNQFRPEGHREPRKEVGSQSKAKHLGCHLGVTDRK